MNRRRITVLVAFVSAIIVAGSLLFSSFVYDSLHRQSVTDVLEVTAQGRNALDTFFEKDLDTLDLFADELEGYSSGDVALLDEKVALFDGNDEGAAYLCANLETGRIHRLGVAGDASFLDEDRIDEVERHGDRSVISPFIDEETGVNMIGVYEKIVFADGVAGLVRKARPLRDVAERYALSFYDDTGFSYVVDRSGDIVIRSSHRNSNRTIANIYDLVEHEGNDEASTASFRAALENDERGVAQFAYQGDGYAFCFVPLASTDGWDLVSVIPTAVLMKQANVVLQATFALCAVIVAGLSVVLVIYWRSSSAHRKQVERLAYFDQLTGLASTAKFELDGNRLLRAAREAEKRRKDEGGEPAGVAVAYLNIADFKLVNDIDGYRRGDDILREVGAILEDECAEGLSCRSTADHFLLMIPYRTARDAVRRCERIVERCRGIVAAGKPLAVLAGVCRSTDAPDAATVTELTDRARIAKTEGQRLGVGICVFSASMRETMLRRADIERSMEDALASGEFFPLVQPKFDVDGSRVLGGEALVRWNRPGEGVVSPAEFVPVFEQNGFIVKLDEHLFERVCQEQRRRLDAGLPTVPVSVNVSRLHLHRSAFVPTYVRIKNAYGIPDELAELELTESMVLEDLENAVAVIGELRRAGFRCSIDDFGSGQSSLNALKELPADELKLDRAFLFEHDHSEKEEVIVRTVIDMAGKLDMKTVMEGVETQEQLDFIKTTSCDMIQGFVFSRPVPWDEFERLLDSQ